MCVSVLSTSEVKFALTVTTTAHAERGVSLTREYNKNPMVGVVRSSDAEPEHDPAYPLLGASELERLALHDGKLLELVRNSLFDLLRDRGHKRRDDVGDNEGNSKIEALPKPIVERIPKD